MLPLGHAAVAYLLYVGYGAVRSHRLPARWALPVVAVGSQLPDLIDKPLAYAGVLGYGRSLAHSVFVWVVVSVTVWWVGHVLAGRWAGTDWRERLRVVAPGAFAVGYGSHLLADAHRAVLAGDFFGARFLLYPLYVIEGPGEVEAPWVRLVTIYRNMETHPQLELILVALLVFVGLRGRAYWQARRQRRTH